MELSVVVPTLNGREELAGCLDALAEHVPDAEVIVVNGPSADGTTGMVRDRDDVSVLVEIADRSVNTARNAGLDRVTRDAVALVDQTLSISEGWAEAVHSGLAAGAVVTGPTHEHLTAGLTTDSKEMRTIAGREVTYFNPGNVAFRREVLDALDGFDEYLAVGGARDLAHRLSGTGHGVIWDTSMTASREFESDGGMLATEWSNKYRSLSYRLVKNYGLRPTVVRRIVSHAGRDGIDALRGVLRNETALSEWLGTGRTVVGGVAVGIKDGLLASLRDRTDRRNPNGRSVRADRAVTVYDWR